MIFRTHAIDNGLNRAVEDFDNHHQQHRADQQDARYRPHIQPNRHDDSHHRRHQFLAECGFVLPGSG
ncbi:hypothetical protein D3C78_1779260 [compost metagenome]